MVVNEEDYPIEPTWENHSNKKHRQIAFEEIYEDNEEDFRFPFREYVVHHIDTDPKNYSVDNLYLCTEENHNRIHKEQKRTKKKFKNVSEIDNFLIKRQKEEEREEIRKARKKERREPDYSEYNLAQSSRRVQRTQREQIDLNPFGLFGSWLGLIWAIGYVNNVYEGSLQWIFLYPINLVNTTFFQYTITYDFRLTMIILIYGFLYGYIVHLLLIIVYLIIKKSMKR